MYESCSFGCMSLPFPSAALPVAAPSSRRRDNGCHNGTRGDGDDARRRRHGRSAPGVAVTLDAARAALDRGDFAAAVAALDADTDAGETAEGIELLAQAAYGNGDFERAVASWERLHAVQRAAGDEPEAARAAAMVAMYLMMDTGLMAPVRGWLQQAERLAARHPDAVAHAIVAMTRTYERFMCGDMAAARQHSTEAIELGDRLGFTPATVIGRVAAARVTIYEGAVDDGLAQLDEVGALLMSGTVDPLTTGMMYCELICAAQGLGLHRRANEWTDTMEHWRTGAAFGGINGRCRVHRAEMLRLSGPCDEAEQEALGACDELRPWMRREFGWPLGVSPARGALDNIPVPFVQKDSPQSSAAFFLSHLGRSVSRPLAEVARECGLRAFSRSPLRGSRGRANCHHRWG